MPLSPTQQTQFKTDVLADPALAALPPNSDSAFEIARVYNLMATPDFYVWKTILAKHEVVSQTSPEATNFSYPALIARSAGEQFGWQEVWNSTLTCNPSLPNVRQAFLDIFSGSQNNAPAQRAHLNAMAKRKATRVEKLLATGTGALATPATMGYEGPLGFQDVMLAMGW